MARIVQRCVDGGAAYSVDIEVPLGKQWRKVGARQTELLVRTGVPVDDGLLAKVSSVEQWACLCRGKVFWRIDQPSAGIEVCVLLLVTEHWLSCHAVQMLGLWEGKTIVAC